jgi:hypothetical protein
MTITIHNVEQGTPEWHELRRGIITASEVKLLMTPMLKPANNDKSRRHIYELAAQRYSGFVEPHYQSDAMAAGHFGEIVARGIYSDTWHPVDQVGFITRDFGNVRIGYSPDGLIGDDGLIEIKTRAQKYTVETGVFMMVPGEHILQVQAGLLVSGRQWCDYICFTPGLPLVRIRVEAEEKMQKAILDVCLNAEVDIADRARAFERRVTHHKWPATERLPDDLLIDGGDNE